MRSSLGRLGERLIEEVIDNFLHGLAGEELAMGEDLVQDQAEAEDVGAAVDVSITAGQLGRHVKGRAVTAPDRREGGIFIVTHLGMSNIRFAPDFGQAPVDDVGDAKLAGQNIGGLEVSMDHTARVRVRDGFTSAREDVDQRGQRKGGRGGGIAVVQGVDDIAQVAAAHVFHREKQITITIAAEFVERHGAGVGDVGSDAGFAQEPLRLDLILAQVIVQGFVDDRAPQVFVERRIQLGDTAFAEQLKILILQRAAAPA